MKSSSSLSPKKMVNSAILKNNISKPITISTNSEKPNMGIFHIKTSELLEVPISQNQTGLTCPFSHEAIDKYFKKNKESKHSKPGKMVNVNEIKLQKRNTIALSSLEKESSNDQSFNLSNKEIFQKFWDQSLTKKSRGNDDIISAIGEEKLSMIVKTFLNKIVQHSDFVTFFKGKNLEKLYEGMISYLLKNLHHVDLASVSLRTIHMEMNITNQLFDLFKGIFSITLREYQVSENYVLQIMDFFEKIRRLIVQPTPTPMEKILNIIPGGLKKLFTVFYERLKKNTLIDSIFKNWDSEKHRKHFQYIIDYLARDSKLRSDVREIHLELGLNSHIMYHMKMLIILSLRDLKIDEELIFLIIDKFEDARLDLLNQKTYFEQILEKISFEELSLLFLNNLKHNQTLMDLFQINDDDRLQRHCSEMLVFCLGGPTKYRSCDITPSHVSKQITSEHYLLMSEIFEKTLRDIKMDEQDIIYILTDLDHYKYDICNQKCIFEKIGGEKTIESIVHGLYLKTFQDPRICGYYKNTEFNTMIKNQCFFFKKFFGAKMIKSYHLKDLRTFHLNLELNDEHFDFFSGIIINMAKDLGVSDPEIIKELMRLLNRSKNDVLNLKNNIDN